MRIKTLLAALVMAFVLAFALPSAASANTAGHACNHLRWGGSQNTAAYYNNAYFGANQWSWGVQGFVVTLSQVRADGSGYCQGYWPAYRTSNANSRLNCHFYANSDPWYNITQSRFIQCTT